MKEITGTEIRREVEHDTVRVIAGAWPWVLSEAKSSHRNGVSIDENGSDSTRRVFISYGCNPFPVSLAVYSLTVVRQDVPVLQRSSLGSPATDGASDRLRVWLWAGRRYSESFKQHVPKVVHT